MELQAETPGRTPRGIFTRLIGGVTAVCRGDLGSMFAIVKEYAGR